MLDLSYTNGRGPRKGNSNKDIGWAQSWLNSHQNRIDFIPTGYFDHRGLGLTRKH
jgi:hypothetical protein